MASGGRTSAPWWRVAMLVGLAAPVVGACIEDVDLGKLEAGSAAAGGGGLGLGGTAAIAGAPGAAGAGGCEPATCSGKIYACGDCIDNDMDGFVDADDSQCLGPCDATEDSFFGGIPGQNNSPCRQDCYFDSDTGPGNDDCYWSHRCDPLSLPDDYPPSGDMQCAYDEATNISGTAASCGELALEQTQVCRDTCLPFVPNGCDCFGCCELPAGSGQFVWLGSNSDGAGSCSEETLGDPTACRACTPVTSCYNACDECELCAGRARADATCETPNDGTCGGDYEACGRPGQEPCPPGTYCITGCCISVPK